MSSKPLLLLLLSLALATNVAAAQAPDTEVPIPQIYWKLGNVSGLKLKRGQVVDGFLQYYVVVPTGTAASYSVNVDFCEWAPVPANIPDRTQSCSSADEIPVRDLREVEPGRLYEGQFYYSLEPGDVEFKRVNRLSFTLNLRKLDGADPQQVIARQELNLIVFAGVKGSSNQSASTGFSPSPYRLTRTPPQPRLRPLAV